MRPRTVYIIYIYAVGAERADKEGFGTKKMRELELELELELGGGGSFGQAKQRAQANESFCRSTCTI